MIPIPGGSSEIAFTPIFCTWNIVNWNSADIILGRRSMLPRHSLPLSTSGCAKTNRIRTDVTEIDVEGKTYCPCTTFPFRLIPGRVVASLPLRNYGRVARHPRRTIKAASSDARRPAEVTQMSARTATDGSCRRFYFCPVESAAERPLLAGAAIAPRRNAAPNAVNTE
jgi:hypothetical protein